MRVEARTSTSSAPRHSNLAARGATLDGLHYNDRVNWRKSQALLAELCAPGRYMGGRAITVTHTATHRVQDLFHSP